MRLVVGALVAAGAVFPAACSDSSDSTTSGASGATTSTATTTTGQGGQGGTGQGGAGGGTGGTAATGGMAGASGSSGASGGLGNDAAAGDANDASMDAGRDATPDASAGGASDGSVDAVVEAPVTRPSPLAKLSATGLFTAVNPDGSLQLAGGVQPFQPKYALWSDGAAKLRWVYLPPGKKIDTSDPDHWSFPVGTKFWKEFAIGNKRVETRLIERFGPGPDDYVYAAYWWKSTDAAQASDADLADPDSGVLAANGTTHDIPKRADCSTCHDALKEHVLGFGALQLNHTLPGLTVTGLAQGAWLSQPLPSNLDFPGPDAKTRDALGYLHANCGNCHNTTPGVFMIPEPRMDLRVLVGQTLAQTGTYRTAVNNLVTKYNHPSAPEIKYRIRGGDTAQSCVTFRMGELGMMDRMPPIASKVVDTTGIAAVNAWIATLPAPP